MNVKFTFNEWLEKLNKTIKDKNFILEHKTLENFDLNDLIETFELNFEKIDLKKKYSKSEFLLKIIDILKFNIRKNIFNKCLDFDNIEKEILNFETNKKILDLVLSEIEKNELDNMISIPLF